MKLLLSCIALLSLASLSHAQGYCVNGQCYGYTPAPSYQTQYYGAWGGYGNGAPSYYPQTYWTAPRQPTYYQAPIYSPNYGYSGYYTQPSYYGGYGYGASYYNGGCVGGQCFR